MTNTFQFNAALNISPYFFVQDITIEYWSGTAGSSFSLSYNKTLYADIGGSEITTISALPSSTLSGLSSTANITTSTAYVQTTPFAANTNYVFTHQLPQPTTNDFVVVCCHVVAANAHGTIVNLNNSSITTTTGLVSAGTTSLMLNSAGQPPTASGQFAIWINKGTFAVSRDVYVYFFAPITTLTSSYGGPTMAPSSSSFVIGINGFSY